jgi:hypothetical protein
MLADAVTGSLNGRMVSHLIREMEHSDGTPNGDSVAFVTASRRAFRVTSGTPRGIAGLHERALLEPAHSLICRSAVGLKPRKPSTCSPAVRG